MGARVNVPFQGRMIEGEIVEFQEREPGKWLEFYLPEEKKWLRVKPSLIRVVKISVPDRFGGDTTFMIFTGNIMDVVPE